MSTSTADADLDTMASPPAPVPAARRRGRASTPYLFLAPFAVVFIGFVLVPAIYGIWISLHDYSFTLPHQPLVGLQNYFDLFTPGTRDSANFWHSMLATGIFTVISVPFLIVCPLGIALLLNQVFPGRTLFRAIFFAPYVLGSRWSECSSASCSTRTSAWSISTWASWGSPRPFRGPPSCRGPGSHWW